MLVTLITRKRIDTLVLPEKIRGQFWLYEQKDNTATKLISIEANDENWMLKANRRVLISENGNNNLRNVVLKPMSIYKLRVIDGEGDAFVFAEPNTRDRQAYTKRMVVNNCEISIGRENTNDIIVNNDFVSSKHAKLTFYDNKWFFEDLGSANGSFVNGLSVKKKELVFGDVLWIMGLKIIFGKNLIALNNPDFQAQIATNVLLPFINQNTEIIDVDDDDFEMEPQEYFYRSPRFKRDIEEKTFKIDSPPNNNNNEEMPFILVVGPSVTMGMASMTTALFAINNAMTNGNIQAAIPSIVMSSSMLLGTILWPILSKRFEKKRKTTKEALRQKKYKEYLDRISVKFSEECSVQEEIMHENFITIQNCVDRIVNVERNLWERGSGQNDFLQLRVGIGNGELQAAIAYSERRFTIDEDNLQEELYTLCERPKILSDIPITLSLFEDYVSGIIGERKKTIEFVKKMVFQLVSFYSYDEVKLVFLYDKNEEADFEFTKWLPHTWSNDNKFRFLVTDNNEMKEVSAYLERIVSYRLNVNEGEMADVVPYYIVFAMNKSLTDKAESLKILYTAKRNLNFSIVNCFDELKNLPKECTMVVELDGNEGKLFDKNDISGKTIKFTPDSLPAINPGDLGVRLANIQLDNLANSFKLPNMVTFLEMFEVGKVEHLNSLTRWKENDPTLSLQAEIGIDTSGELFKLDLHEKFHGPHGLVAGMTGSGKSEFIITYILSLAVNYHPDEVAFILIDYKGGGMAKSFEELPHTAGIITNLDGASIKRSLISIESELKRRQAIFAETSKKIEVSNIDIYKYQRLYREGLVSEPLQHLFIISDEFAELKTQQSDFMQQLVSAARIGRSLGIHLILATQKPSGVVDDQIWSNSKFRVCLKVQERSDSMDMLKRPDAAELTNTGRFYLQVGYNELFELGQSAWAGALYYPSDKAVVEKDNSVVIIDKNGRTIREARNDNKKGASQYQQKQLDSIVDYLKAIASEEKIKVKPLWLEPISSDILLSDVKTKYRITEKKNILNPLVGEYDDPTRQRQSALRVPLSKEGNVIIYGSAGSGKTTFLNTLIYSLITEHTPNEVNIYLLDFASETLRAFAQAPHVGDVILSYETERINNLFKMVKKELDTRKKLFADYGGDYASYISATGNEIPAFVVMINNFAAFTELYEEKEEAVSYLTREGTKYGIYFVLTALGTGAVRFRLIQNFKQLFVLQLNDVADYSTVLGKTDGLYPSHYGGRGLIRIDDLYEFQIAQATREEISFAFFQKECQRLNEMWEGTKANKTPVLPEDVDMEFLAQYINNKKVFDMPIGVEKSSLQVYKYPFAQSYINSILSINDEGQEFLYTLGLFAESFLGLDVTLIDGKQAFAGRDLAGINYYSDANDIEKVIAELFDLVLYRNNTYKEAQEQGMMLRPFEHKMVFINSIQTLKNQLSDEIKEKLGLVLEKGNVKYNVIIVFFEQAKNVAMYSFDPWFKEHVSSSEGIWVGNGITEQYQLKPNKTTKEMREDEKAGFGFGVQKGKAVKIKLLSLEKGDSVEDE